MAENRDCGADAAAYVLGALETEEAEAFRAHMAGCVVCRDEVSAFQAVADELPLTAPPQPVPRSLKRSVMAAVYEEPRGSEQSVRRDRRWRLGGGTLTWPRWGLAGAATALAVVIAAVVVALGSGGESVRQIQASVTWPGHAVLTVSGNRGELVVSGMPQAPSGNVYEVWVKRGARPPAPTSSLFDVTSSGAGAVDVPGVRGASVVMVTAEPHGGSRAPTHPPVLVAKL